MTGIPTESIPCTVLVTEDDPSIRRLVSMALRRRRLNTRTASDGSEALELLARQEWGVLVLDLMMPKVSGWEVVEWLAANPEKKPKTVIVVSAADREMLRRLDPTVVNAVIFKPFDIFQLTAYVKASCELHHGDRRSARTVAT